MDKETLLKKIKDVEQEMIWAENDYQEKEDELINRKNDFQEQLNNLRQ